MRIQVINYSKERQEGNVLYTKISSPRSLDEFDIVVIDLSDEYIWRNDSQRNDSLNCINDFISIRKMISDSKVARLIYVLPPNCDFYYDKSYERYHKTKKLKDMLVVLKKDILSQVIPNELQLVLVFENTETTIAGTDYEASFTFKTDLNDLSRSNGSNKKTTVQLNERQYLTSLQITSSTAKLVNFLSYLIMDRPNEEPPEWIREINCFDDIEQKEKISASRIKIQQEEAVIYEAEGRLLENAMYKSILYTNGDKLVEVVYKILEKLLNYDLSEFVDKKKEDFLIKKPDYTFIGEIKGVSSNVKNENISQLEIHYQQYRDQLVENSIDENVHQLLIINPQRDRPLYERDPINEDKIRLANHYGSLIVETKTLLRIYEAFIQNKLTVRDCEELFLSKTGLLEEKDIGLPESGS